MITQLYFKVWHKILTVIIFANSMNEIIVTVGIANFGFIPGGLISSEILNP